MGEAEFETGYHYQLIRRAISIIDGLERGDKRLSLEALAQEMQMSLSHFQKLFTRYAGVSPARYQQFLRLSHAKELLRARFTTLQTADEIGLSGGGRLYDLFLRWEAMSPGCFAQGGAGMDIFYGWVDSPFDTALIMANTHGVCGIAFAGAYGREKTLKDMQKRWPLAHYIENNAHIQPLGETIFSYQGRLKLCLIGAPFQLNVWEALLSIPPGFVTTYSALAQRIGAPKAVRATGTAVGRNPISLLIPCHRVLRKSGELGGYHWGLTLKRRMLADESARFEGRPYAEK